MSPSADTIDADSSLDEVVATMLRQNRRWAPVVDGAGYVGLIAVTDISTDPDGRLAEHHRPRRRPHRRRAGRARRSPSTVAAERMRTSHSDAIAVTTRNTVIGVVTLRDLTNVEVLLDRLNNESS